MPDGNTTQNRVIMESVADTAITRFVEKHPEVKGSKISGSIPAWIACGLSVATLIWGAAVISSDVSENRRRIEAIEVEQLQQSRDDQASRDRLARIEAKIDVLMGGKS